MCDDRFYLLIKFKVRLVLVFIIQSLTNDRMGTRCLTEPNHEGKAQAGNCIEEDPSYNYSTQHRSLELLEFSLELVKRGE